LNGRAYRQFRFAALHGREGFEGLNARAPTFPADLALRAEGLALARGGRTLARDLTFSVAGGGALVVVGPNGAGKSTLLRALAGLLAPAEGRISLAGLGEDGETPGRCAHYVGHADALKGALTVAENLSFWASALGGGGIGPTEALAAFGLAHTLDLPAGALSAGQKRRASLARLLVARRPVWLLDEPSTALDVASQARLADAMAAHRAAGGLIIAATHAPLGLAGAAELRLGGSS
jgi:heme exporter protein A